MRTLCFILQIGGLIAFVWCLVVFAKSLRTGAPFKEVSTNKWNALRQLFDFPTKLFFASAIVAMIGIDILTSTMHINLLHGAVDPAWRVALGMALLGQMVPVTLWYLIVLHREEKDTG